MSPEITSPSVSTVADTPGGHGTKPTPVVPDHQLIRRIAEGGYGEVWLARSALGTYRAVSRLSPFVQRRTRVRAGVPRHQMFEPSRSNDGLLDILQAGRGDRDGYYYYVMELADDANAECGIRNAESAGSVSGKVGEWESGANAASASRSPAHPLTWPRSSELRSENIAQRAPAP